MKNINKANDTQRKEDKFKPRVVIFWNYFSDEG